MVAELSSTTGLMGERLYRAGRTEFALRMGGGDMAPFVERPVPMLCARSGDRAPCRWLRSTDSPRMKVGVGKELRTGDAGSGGGVAMSLR